MYIHIHVNKNTHTYIYIHVYIYVSVYIYMCIDVFVLIFLYIHRLTNRHSATPSIAQLLQDTLFQTLRIYNKSLDTFWEVPGPQSPQKNDLKAENRGYMGHYAEYFGVPGTALSNTAPHYVALKAGAVDRTADDTGIQVISLTRLLPTASS